MWLRYLLVVGFAVGSLSFPIGRLPRWSQLPFVQGSTSGTGGADSTETIQKLNRLIRRQQGVGGRKIGVAIISLSSDSLVLACNATAPMVPASNQKLLTTTAAWPIWGDELMAAIYPRQDRPAAPAVRRRGAPSRSRVTTGKQPATPASPLFDFPERDSVTGLSGYDVLCRIHKWSDNQLANRLLKTLSAQRRMTGQELVRHCLDSLGIWSGGLNIIDGSGRSPANRIAPLTIVQVLRTMYHAPKHEAFVSSLPRAGSEGTLRRRNLGLGDRVMAKTGSINGTFSLSGYLLGENDTFAFSVLLNQWYDKAAAFRFFGDLLCTLDQRPPPPYRRGAVAYARHRSRARKGVR